MRKTKIIATIGPASESEVVIKQLIQAGVDIFRLNLSHNKRIWHEMMIRRIQKISKKVQILIDTRGPEIRIGLFEGIISIKENDEFSLVIDQKDQSVKNKKIFIAYPKIIQTVEVGDSIAIDGGMLFAKVIEISSDHVKCIALSDWDLSAKRHVNLPGERVQLPTITKEDKSDVEYFVKNHNIDYIALSFTRKADDIRQLKKIALGTKIIAKIENFEGINNFCEILAETDGVMVARGDLGVEMPLEKIPVFQRKIITKTRQAQKFVIVATEMLESMVKSPRPTRAEVSDIATAVWESADAVMLSGETAMGKYPIRTVETMRKVIEFTEEEMAILP